MGGVCWIAPSTQGMLAVLPEPQIPQTPSVERETKEKSLVKVFSIVAEVKKSKLRIPTWHKNLWIGDLALKERNIHEIAEETPDKNTLKVTECSVPMKPAEKKIRKKSASRLIEALPWIFYLKAQCKIYVTFKIVFTGRGFRGSKTSPSLPISSRKSGFLTYPHPPFALKKPWSSQRCFPYPWKKASTNLCYNNIWKPI